MDYTITKCDIICHIDECCKSNVIKYADLAASVGIDVKTLYKIRKGKQLPSVLLAELIAHNMHVETEKLFEIKVAE